MVYYSSRIYHAAKCKSSVGYFHFLGRNKKEYFQGKFRSKEQKQACREKWRSALSHRRIPAARAALHRVKAARPCQTQQDPPLPVAQQHRLALFSLQVKEVMTRKESFLSLQRKCQEQKILKDAGSSSNRG